ncbi:hypothetical protein Acr_00g0016770 [Actinidia rufa]|uniref:Uncharacterized protein n=1 Tax=Actinidia rufa TaxID=165716 RepID=A0A7J0DBK4_9ERIC|nr:hypothetical protein Acr_00g0016770 [Actinidia rufa]
MIGILSKRKSSLLFRDRGLEFAVAKPNLCYGKFGTSRHLIGWSGEVIGLLEQVAQLEPSRFGVWLVFAIGRALLSNGLLALGLDSKLGRQFESRGDSGSHHLVSERRLSLLNQGIHGYWSACSGVDGVDTGVQVLDLFEWNRWMIGILSKRKSSLLFRDRGLEFAVAKPNLCYGKFGTSRHLIGWSGEVIGLL